MIKAPIPSNEVERYQNLLEYDILDSQQEVDYNDLIQLAATICQCPTAMITFIDKDRQWFKASINIDDKESTREDSFCGHAILSNELMIVNDAAKDIRFADNPEVTGGLNIQFYAGAPITSTEGYNLGAVCVIDNTPRKNFTAQQQQSLKIISAQVGKLLELRMKNKIIVDQTKTLLQKEKNIAKLNAVNREKENDHIAYQLHENIAQILAVAKMSVEAINHTKTDKEKLIEQVKKYLSLSINDVKELSRSITPTTFKSDDYSYYIKQIVKEHNTSGELQIEYLKDSESLKLNATLGLTIFRILEYMIKYAKLAGATKATFKISTLTKELLYFNHNGQSSLDNTDEAAMLLNNISTRAEIIHATYDKQANNNVITINIPDE